MESGEDRGLAAPVGAVPLEAEGAGEEEWRCAVCRGATATAENGIVECDGCGVQVHEQCYGIGELPEGAWHCERCAVAKGSPEPRAAVLCAACKQPGGAMVRITGAGLAHLQCAYMAPALGVVEVELDSEQRKAGRSRFAAVSGTNSPARRRSR